MSQASHYDLLIVGGGMVGASLAHSLAGRGLRIGVIEAYPLQSDSQPSYDDRAIALAYGSRLILEGMGRWSALGDRAEPILHIHVSDRGHFGFARLHAEDEGVEALGYVATARDLGHMLLADLGEAPGVELICPAQLSSFEVHSDRVDARLLCDGTERTLSANLLVAADGGKSMVRERLGIESRVWTYGHTAVIANITAGRPHQGVAYERFTDSGPLAMLPMSDDRCGLVWTTADAQVEERMALSDAEFLAQLQERFGYRLGRLRQVGRRSAYPLQLMQAKEHVRARVALIGNAAHTVHPIAGQGYNLGIRDAAVLAEVLDDAREAAADIGSEAVLQRYAEWRRGDQNTVAYLTDGMARLFSNPLAGLRVGRNLGILAADLIPGGKHLIARQAMGLRGQLSKLARGLPLGR